MSSQNVSSDVFPRFLPRRVFPVRRLLTSGGASLTRSTSPFHATKFRWWMYPPKWLKRYEPSTHRSNKCPTLPFHVTTPTFAAAPPFTSAIFASISFRHLLLHPSPRHLLAPVFFLFSTSVPCPSGRRTTGPLTPFIPNRPLKGSSSTNTSTN